MSQAWCHVFLNIRNNLFQTKGKLVWMVNSKFESFQKLIKNCVWSKSIFLLQMFVIYRISWEWINNLMLCALKWAWFNFLAIVKESFFQSALVYFHRITLLWRYFTLLSVFSSFQLLDFAQIETGVEKSTKKIITRRITAYWDFLRLLPCPVSRPWRSIHFSDVNQTKGLELSASLGNK